MPDPIRLTVQGDDPISLSPEEVRVVEAVSPEATVRQTPTGATIEIKDYKHGVTRAQIQNGENGISPGISVASISGGHRLTIIDADHPLGQTVDILDGANGRGIASAVLNADYTLTITYTDGTTYTTPSIRGEQGAGITSIAYKSTSGLVDTYTITYGNGATADFTVTNGASAYVWIRYAQQEPTQDSDMSTTPGPWMGICSGASDTAPTDYTAYTWYRIKGDAGPVQDVQVNGVSVLQDGVANVPLATESKVGVARADPNYGTGIYSQRIFVARAPDDFVRNGVNTYRPIVPSTQHAAAFYGLAKAAGDTTQSASSNAVGSYTNSAIDKILAMMGVDALIGKHETSATASEAKAIGDVFIFAGKLYKATDAIASGAAIVPGTNCTQTNLIELIRGT